MENLINTKTELPIFTIKEELDSVSNFERSEAVVIKTKEGLIVASFQTGITNGERKCWWYDTVHDDYIECDEVISWCKIN